MNNSHHYSTVSGLAISSYFFFIFKSGLWHLLFKKLFFVLFEMQTLTSSGVVFRFH